MQISKWDKWLSKENTSKSASTTLSNRVTSFQKATKTPVAKIATAAKMYGIKNPTKNGAVEKHASIEIANKNILRDR